MTANVILNQFDPIRQAASDYLSQCYQILARLTALIEELEPFLPQKDDLSELFPKVLNRLLSSFQAGIELAHNALDENVNPYLFLAGLNINQIIGTALLEIAADKFIQVKDILLKTIDDIAIYDGFDTYSAALAKEDK